VKALYKAAAGPGLELVERPDPPPPAALDVKIRVLRTGICGTDLHIECWDSWAAGAVNAPLIVGHEFCGVVTEVGDRVRDIRVGDLVSGEGHIVCGICRNCRAGRRHLCIRTSSVGVNRDGAFAEFIVLPERNVWVHRDLAHIRASHSAVSAIDTFGPGDTAFAGGASATASAAIELLPPALAGFEAALDVAAIFDPFGNAVHTALSFPLVGEDVLITGAGPIGLMAAAVCRRVGARYVLITDISQPRLELARTMGVDLAIDPREQTIVSAQKKLGMVEGFDVALEMSGHPSALADIVSNLNHGGRVAMLGLPSGPISIDWARVVSHMITIKGIYGREMFETWYAMSALLRSGLDISPVITDRVPATEWQQAFKLAREGQRGKVVMDWTVL
jgi:threonine 3-dehydrogenase